MQGDTDRPTTDESRPEMSPEDVKDHFNRIVEYQAERESMKSPLEELLTPRNRMATIDALLTATEPQTAREIADMANIDVSTFNDSHRDFLLEAGVLKQPGKKGNARVYTLNDAHPAVQLIRMLDTVIRHGVTPDLLDDQFVDDPVPDDA